MNTIPNALQGVPVNIVDPVQVTESVKRTWKERLFTRPFTPSVSHKEVKTLTEMMPDGQILKAAHGLFMNAKTFNDCEKAIFNKATGAQS